MRYTKQQKIKDLKLLKNLLKVRHEKNEANAFSFDGGKRLFLCFLIEENIKDFDPHFYGWFTDQLYLIDTEYKDFKSKTLTSVFFPTISSLIRNEIGVWSAYDYENRLKFINHLVKSLS